jgi:hypothetical protein
VGFERTSEAPERFALYGEPNAGKTYAAFMIAKRLQLTGSPAQMFYLDCDNAYFDMVDEFELDNVHHLPFDPDEFEEFEEAVAKAKADAQPKRGDWLVIDRGEPTWEAAQQAYSQAVRGTDIDEWRLQVRARQNKGGDKDKRGGLQGFEWADIKKMYRKPWMRIITSGCNVMGLYGAAKVGTDSGEFSTATKEEVEMYSTIGRRPAGGAGVREMVHAFRDVYFLRCVSLKREEFRITAAKARARKVKLENEPITDFSVQVLLKVNGWRMARNG